MRSPSLFTPYVPLDAAYGDAAAGHTDYPTVAG